VNIADHLPAPKSVHQHGAKQLSEKGAERKVTPPNKAAAFEELAGGSRGAEAREVFILGVGRLCSKSKRKDVTLTRQTRKDPPTPVDLRVEKGGRG